MSTRFSLLASSSPHLAPVGSTAPTVRMNWDTLYSCRIVKVSDDHTFEILLPKGEC